MELGPGAGEIEAAAIAMPLDVGERLGAEQPHAGGTAIAPPSPTSPSWSSPRSSSGWAAVTTACARWRCATATRLDAVGEGGDIVHDDWRPSSPIATALEWPRTFGPLDQLDRRDDITGGCIDHRRVERDALPMAGRPTMFSARCRPDSSSSRSV